MCVPDAPWIGMCREDYYGYEEETAYCECCGRECDEYDLIDVNGDLFCEKCYSEYYDEEEEDEQL